MADNSTDDMPKPRKDQDEKDLEKLAKKLLSTPPKPREESKVRTSLARGKGATKSKPKKARKG